MGFSEKGCVATIGTFDGVHRGHRYVVDQVVNLSRQRGLDAVVVTFADHPLQVLRKGVTPQLLTLKEEKVELLEGTGIDRVALLDFTPELAQMSAYEFMQQVLVKRLGVKVLLVGYDNHFGHDRRGFQDCVGYGKELGMEVVACDCLTAEGDISSTAVRNALLDGDIEAANDMLGYPYSLQGKVVAGFQNGRKMGYPTANLQVDAKKLIPENGVYLVKTTDEGEQDLGHEPLTPLFGMLNIGTRPTLHNGRQQSIEVHLFDFEGNLYGQTLRIHLLHHLRKEREFDSLSALEAQLRQDERECREWKRIFLRTTN